jgi:hypothetical protein
VSSPGVAVLVFKNGHVLEMVLRHELLEGCEVVVVPDLFYHPMHHRLVFSSRHLLSLALVDMTH